MTTYTGTNGADSLIGSTGDDLFTPLLGADTVSGGAGTDTLVIDWSSLPANGGAGTISSTGSSPGSSWSGSLMAGAGAASVAFEGIEAVVATLSAGSDTLTVDAAALASGATLNINGGGGFDTLVADFSAFASTSFALGVNFLITANHGAWAGFEQFDLTLGAGTNAVTLQGGNDTVRSTGGTDTLDLGAGRDTWLADFSGWSANISFGWDGDRNLAAVSNGTYVSHVEGGAITGGSGDDAFFLNGANGFAVDGGAGRDLLVWDESGRFTAPYSAAFLAGPAGGFEGWVRTSTFTGIEQVNAALSDGDNSAFVDVAPLAAGATMNLDGGLGTDRLEVDFSAFADTTFFLDAAGTAYTSHGTYGNFEHFGMALGTGHNTVATGAGDDTIYSLGGVDQIDAGAGFDSWGGDWSESATPIAFAWNGTAGSGTLSNGTTLAGFETGYLVGSAGDDSFRLSGALPFDVFGGAGVDALVRDDTGITGANGESFVFSATGWFWGFAGNGQFDEIERLTITFGDADDTVYADAAALAAGATLSLNGGRGVDALLLDLSALAGSVFTVGGDSAVSGNRGSYAGFESYSIGLGSGTNAITLGAGNDTLQAAFGGVNAIDAGAGDDEVWGGTGTETVLGGAGTDRFHVAGRTADFSVVQDGFGGYWLTDRNTADGDQGTDRLTGVEWVMFDDGTLALPAYSGGQTLTGTAGADTLTGTAFADKLFGLDGNDQLFGGNGNDTLNGGAGNDTITGGAGIDTATYDDATGAVKISLAITGKAQSTGGAGNDTLNDLVENLTGSAFADTLTGNALGNVLVGLAGNDTIDGGAGADTLIGGLGNDNYVVDSSADIVIEAAGEGTDKVTASASFALGAEIENLALAGTEAIDGTGNELANTLTGNSAANRIYGMDGNDLLDGGAGADTLAGGLGNDSYVVDNTADLVVEGADEGIDAVSASVSFTLSANVENLTLAGTAALNGTGNALANALTGNSAANLLSGLDGADTLSGGGGNDTLNGGAGDDTLIGGAGADALTGGGGVDRFRFDLLETAANKDTIKDFVHGEDKIELVRSAFSGLTGLSAGALSASGFTLGTVATTAAQHLIYNQATGALYYDKDGVGSTAAVQIALLSTKPVLDAGDFWLV